MPYLARVAAEPDASDARKEAVNVVFQAFNRYLGVAVGEHLGYPFTGTWSVLVGAAIMQSDEVPAWLGVAGIAVDAVLALCSLEFVGPFELDGWKVAAALTPVTYIAWSLWRRQRAWQCCCDLAAHLLFHSGNPRETQTCL